MKKQTTKKAIMSAYRNVIKVGYCDLQDALKWREPNFYTVGVYGWNADVYVIDYDTVIVTGYRPFGNIELPRNVIDALNKGAKSAMQLLKNNLDDLAPGIKFDFDTFGFGGATIVPELKRKLKMSMNSLYGVHK